MSNTPFAIVLALGGALAGFAMGACDKSGDSTPAQDSGVTKASCLDVRNCVRDNCAGSLSAEESETCVKGCLDQAGPAAQQDYRNLIDCLVNTCCTDTAGCGGGDPKCSANGTPACESCTCKAQCAAEGARCRMAAKICFGLEPNCSTCS